MKIFCYKDIWKWGETLVRKAKNLNIEAHLFLDSFEVPDEVGVYVFIHLSHIPPQRAINKEIAVKIAQKKNVILIPTPIECEMYDDKLAFALKCSEWTPKTRYLTSTTEAFIELEKITFPFISKSIEGAGSSNVRFISEKNIAKKEIEQTFSYGIPQYGNLHQKNYLLWQDFCPNNPNDWRVIFIAKKFCYILKRYNRDNVPFASGSGRLEAIVELNEETNKLLELGRNFVEKFDFNFCGMDVVYDKDKNPVILEITTGWNLECYKNCTIFEYQNINNKYVSTGLDGKDELFEIVIKCIQNGNFK